VRRFELDVGSAIELESPQILMWCRLSEAVVFGNLLHCRHRGCCINVCSGSVCFVLFFFVHG
jgi:hypothetical protein